MIGLDPKMSFCEGLVTMMMIKHLGWIWKWVFFSSRK